MEALAGYGSDSSSGDSSGPDVGTFGSGGGGALAGLLPSDASSSEDERVVPETKKAPPAAPDGGSTALESAATSNSGDAEGSSPTKKRPRLSDGDKEKCNGAASSCPLPAPKLSAHSAVGDTSKGGEQVSNAFEELIRFDKDYTGQLRANLTAAAAAQAANGGSDKTNAKVSQQLDALHKNFYGAGANASGTTDDESGRPTSFASHLRHQHEFGNPNLFPNVVEQFGIEAGGSNLPNKLWKASDEFRDFESCDRLMAAEEQARFRAANTSSNPSG